MFGKLRELGRKVQGKYENVIASKNLFGFSDKYAEAMRLIEERKHRRGAS